MIRSNVSIDVARVALETHFGFPEFRAGQERAVSSVLEGRDTLVVLPTGGGKSLCFQVPALVLPGMTVVVSPLISLMKDQVDALAQRNIPATYINSTLSSSEISERMGRVTRGEVKLLYVAPERFDAGTTAERLKEIGVSLLAVDEAHCISEWGHDFRPSYLRIAQVRERLGWPPVVALTATATRHVREDIARQLRLENPDVIITGFDRTNLAYHVRSCKNDDEKDAALIKLLRARDGVAIVYAATRRNVERIAEVLAAAKISAAAYHAGLDDTHRADVQESFMTERVRAIVATNAFGMGIDKPNVRTVVHHAMPGTLEAYYQEAGRAGRDGKPSQVYVLHAFPDRFTHEFFIKGAHPDRAVIEGTYNEACASIASTGTVALNAAQIAQELPGKVSDREVESAIRILIHCRALRLEPDNGSRAYVRLLATAERIKSDLGASQESLEVLRALWRVATDRLYDGADIDLAALPRTLGQPHAVMKLLNTLQNAQFLEWSRLGGGLFVADVKRPLSAYPLDWETLDRRRRNELSKLDAMQQYAYTPKCRRGFVLRYFGDPAAKDTCDGCDNCMQTHEKPAAKSLAKPAPRDRRQAQRTPRTMSADHDYISPSGADALLLERLRLLRTGIARAQKVPAYVVFADSVLVEFALHRPRSSNALSQIRGVGPVKLEKYGEQFLEVLRSADDTEAA